MSIEQKCRDYTAEMPEKFPCFQAWFTVRDGELEELKEDNHGVLIIFGLPLGVVDNVMDGLRENVNGNHYDLLPKEGVITAKISDIEFFGGQWSDDAHAWEIEPDYWYCFEVVSTKSFKEIAAEFTPELF
jgi:hypothetical protein